MPDLYGLGDAVYGSGAAVYLAALDAGGTSEGEPAIRGYFSDGYYAANIGDFDGNHSEIVHKSFNPTHRKTTSRT